MPVDSKRLPVPENSQTPFAYVQDNEKHRISLLTGEGSRQDGRAPQEFRPMFVKAGVVSQAKGSAYIELNQTKVICAVYGPREVTRREDFSMQGQLNCEFKYATFSSRFRRGHQQDSQEKDFSLVLQQALEPAVRMEKFPKARMDVFLTVLQDDGSALAAGISCASVALADASVEMYDLVVGCTLCLCGDALLLDPSATEESLNEVTEASSNNGLITVGFMPSIHQVAALTQKGALDVNLAAEGIRLCLAACQRVFPVLQQALVKAVKGRLKDGGAHTEQQT